MPFVRKFRKIEPPTLLFIPAINILDETYILIINNYKLKIHDVKIAPITTKEQIFSFNDSLSEEKANSSRVIAALGALLFIIYSVLDYFGLPRETLEILYPVRAIYILILSILFYLTFKPIFLKQYNKILLFGYYASGITVCVGIYLSKSGEYSYNLYFAALLVLIITSCSWSYLPIKQSILMNLTFISAYVLIKIFMHQDTEGTELLIVISHLFYLVSVMVIASTAQYIRDSLIYRNLKLQEDLKSIVGEKTKEAKKQKRLANMDAQTGIPNRRYITKKLQKLITEIERTESQLTLIFIDLNGFKGINDNYGHDSGDKVLEVTAKRLQQTIRDSDYLARLGGDEFLLGFKTEKNSATFIKEVSDNIKTIVAAPIAFNGSILKVGLSLGYAHYPADGKSIEELIKVADADMYTDKRNSKSRRIASVSNISA